MGDAADDMLDGTCCERCGEYFDDVPDGRDPPGHPRTCRSCQIEEDDVDEDWEGDGPDSDEGDDDLEDQDEEGT